MAVADPVKGGNEGREGEKKEGCGSGGETGHRALDLALINLTETRPNRIRFNGPDQYS